MWTWLLQLAVRGAGRNSRLRQAHALCQVTHIAARISWRLLPSMPAQHRLLCVDIRPSVVGRNQCQVLAQGREWYATCAVWMGERQRVLMLC